MSYKWHASATSEGRNGTVAVAPLAGAPFLALESCISRQGITPFVARHVKKLYLPIASFAKLRDAESDWSFEVDPVLEKQIQSMAGNTVNHKRAVQALKNINTTDVDNLLRDFPDRDRLDRHQIQAVAALSHPDIQGMCLFDEQGLGKTIMALFAFHRLHGDGAVGRMVVVCPKNVAFEWAHDAERFFGTQYRVSVVVGNEREKRKLLSTRSDIYITNFETVSSLNISLRQLLEAERGRGLLVIDESYFVKNKDARRTQAVRRLRDAAGRCFVLCGTPAPNAPSDLVEQFNIADGGQTFSGVQVPDDHGSATEVVRNAVVERGLYLRRLKDHVLQLPERTFHKIVVPLQPEQNKAYRATLGELIGALRSVDEVSFKKNLASFAARRMALLQICSNPSSVVSEYSETPAKVLALDSLLEELVSKKGEKVVLWSYFTASLSKIFDRFARFNPVRLDGSVTDTSLRRAAIRQFQEDSTTMLFVANPAAAAAGITLHRARYSIYESLSNQAAHFLQSLDRIHRRGQLRPVEYFFLLAENSIEIDEFHRLEAKQQSAQKLLGDRAKPTMTRLSMLKEALNAAHAIGMDNYAS